MHSEDLYESWKQRRARPGAPEGFADRVMAAVRANPHPPVRPPGRLRALFWSPPVQVGLGAVACAACAFRILQVLGLFFANGVQ